MGYIFGFMSFIIMIITGFLPLILGEKVLSGWWMISHATVAPVFSIFLAVGALFWVKSTGFGFNNGSDDTLLFNDFDNTENSSPVNPTKNNPFSFDTQPAILTQNYWRNKIEGKQRPKEPKSRGYSNRQQGFNHVQWVMAYKFH